MHAEPSGGSGSRCGVLVKQICARRHMCTFYCHNSALVQGEKGLAAVGRLALALKNHPHKGS